MFKLMILRKFASRVLFNFRNARYAFATVSDRDGAWYKSSRPIFWAHAGGGGGYRNSKEAIESSINNGFRIIEVDVVLTPEGVPVLSHDKAPSIDAFLNAKINETETPLTLRSLLDAHASDDVIISVDTEHLSSDFEIVQYLFDNASASLCRRIILQSSSWRVIRQAAKLDCFLSLHFPLWDGLFCDQRWMVPLLARKLAYFGVKTVSFGNVPVTNDVKEVIGKLMTVGIRVSIYGCNDRSQIVNWMSAGVSIFNVDVLSPSILIQR